MADLVHTVHDEHGRLDVLCNNAGIGLAVPAADLRPSALHAGLAARGVGVHALCPGPVDTPLLDRRDLGGLAVPAGVPVRAARDLLGMLPVPLADPDRVARDALRGMARGRPLIVTPASARLVWWAYRLAPGVVLSLARRGERWLAGR